MESVAVGKVTGLHGVKGEVKLFLYGELDIAPGRSFLTTSGATATVKAVRSHGELLLVLFDGACDRDSAACFKGVELFVERGELPELPEGEHYHIDLIGLKVESVSGEDLGKVVGIMETGANDVYEVSGPSGELLLPAIPDVIVDIDIKAGRMTVDPLDGMLPEKEEPHNR